MRCGHREDLLSTSNEGESEPSSSCVKKQAFRLQRCPASPKWKGNQAGLGLEWSSWKSWFGCSLCSSHLGPAWGVLLSQGQAAQGPATWMKVQAPHLTPPRLPWNFVEKMEQRLGRKGQRLCATGTCTNSFYCPDTALE